MARNFSASSTGTNWVEKKTRLPMSTFGASVGLTSGALVGSGAGTAGAVVGTGAAAAGAVVGTGTAVGWAPQAPASSANTSSAAVMDDSLHKVVRPFMDILLV